MADQQLLVYVKAQLEGGAKAEDLKKALLASGWGSSDIDDALKASVPNASPSVAAPVAASPSPSAQAASPKDQQKDQKKEESAAPALKSQNAAAPAGSATTSVDSVVAHEVRFPKEMAEEAKKSGIVPGLADRKFSRGMLIVSAGLGLSLLGNGYLFYNNSTSQSDLGQKVLELTRVKDDVTAQVASLNIQVTDLTKKNSDLTIDNQRMQSMSLSFGQLFGLQLSTTTLGSSTIVSFGAATSSVQIKGSLGQTFSGKVLRFVVYDTSTGLFMPIANSSDIKIDTALKPFVGSEVTVGGTHVAGSREVTATTLNGDPL